MNNANHIQAFPKIHSNNAKGLKKEEIGCRLTAWQSLQASEIFFFSSKDLILPTITLKKSSTLLLRLKASCLDVLSVGKHKLSSIFESSTANTEFSIKTAAVAHRNANRMQAGNYDINVPWIIVIAVACAAIISVVLYNKKIAENKR